MLYLYLNESVLSIIQCKKKWCQLIQHISNPSNAMNSHDGRLGRSSVNYQVGVLGTKFQAHEEGRPGSPAKIKGILTPVQPFISVMSKNVLRSSWFVTIYSLKRSACLNSSNFMGIQLKVCIFWCWADILHEVTHFPSVVYSWMETTIGHQFNDYKSQI